MIPPLALTLGEAAGIGPDITLSAWQQRAASALPPFYVLADADLLARRARLLGFTGKWAIHPDQIASCNEAFAPSTEELERAERLLAALREAEARGEGAAAFNGTMIDEASRKMAEALVARGAR